MGKIKNFQNIIHCVIYNIRPKGLNPKYKNIDKPSWNKQNVPWEM